MKKSLSLIVSIAMVFSLFASVAFAADKTAMDKFNELKAAGIFTGTGDADDAALAEEMDRGSAAVIVARLAQLDTTTPAEPTFSDVNDSQPWYGYVEAAVKAGIIVGNGDGTYTPYDKVTLQELAVMVAKTYAAATGTEIDLTATADVDADDWAKAYIKAATDLGLFSDVTEWTSNATREALVNVTYEAYAAVTEQPAGEVAIADFQATGAKEFTLTFNQPVDDTKATIVVKKGSFPVNVTEQKYSDDKTTVTLNMTSKLAKDDYTVVVSGLGDEDLTQTVSVEAQKITKIEFTSDKAPLSSSDPSTPNDTVNAFVKIYDQYGDDASSILDDAITVSKGDVVSIDGGKITSTVTAGSFSLDETVVVSLLDKASGTFATATLKVSPEASVSTTTVVELYNEDGKELTDAVTNPEDFYFIVEGKDQYGNSIDEADLNSDVIARVVNNSIADVDTTFVKLTIDGKSKYALPLAFGTSKDSSSTSILKAGTTQLVIISKTSGEKTTYDFTVAESAGLDSLSLSAPEYAVAGEKVIIPFQAFDQFGKEITKASDLEKGVASRSVTGTNLEKEDLKFATVYATGKAQLELDTADASGITSAETVYINIVINGSYKNATLSFSLKPAKKPVAITGVEDINTALAKGATTTIKNDKIKVVDQYGRTKHLSDFTGYEAVITSSDTGVSTVGGTVDNVATKTSTLTAVSKGNSTIKLELKETAGDTVDDSAYTFTAKVVERDSIVSYEVADVATVYAGGSDYAKALKVEGVLENGSKVTLPTNDATYFSVSESVYGLIYDGSTGKLSANNDTVDGNADVDPGIELGKDKSFAVVVVVNTKDGSQNIVKQVTVSRVAPAAETLALKDNTGAINVTKESDGIVSISATEINGKSPLQVAQASVEVKDQYGVVLADGVTAGYSSVDVDGSGNLTGLADGDSVNITAVTKNGKALTFTVKVKA